MLSCHHLGCSRYPGAAHCNNDITATNSKLTIDLELLSWKNVIDVMGDKKILKKVIKMGDGFDRPTEGSLAKGNCYISCSMSI